MNKAELLSKMQNELGETSSPGTPFVTAHRVVDAAVRLLKEHGCQYRGVVIEAARSAYDQFVRPLDIPAIPDVLESQIDDALGELLVQSLNAIADRLCAEDDQYLDGEGAV